MPVGGLHTRPVLLPPPSMPTGRRRAARDPTRRPSLRRPGIFGVPAAELTGEVLELGDLVRGSRESGEQLAEPVDAAVAAELVGRMARPAAAAIDPRPRMPAELDRAWQLIVGSGGQCRIGEVAREIGWSRRHLTTRLRAEIGFAAKDLARVSPVPAVPTDDRWRAGTGLADVAGGLRVRRPIAPDAPNGASSPAAPRASGSPPSIAGAALTDPTIPFFQDLTRSTVGMLFP